MSGAIAPLAPTPTGIDAAANKVSIEINSSLKLLQSYTASRGVVSGTTVRALVLGRFSKKNIKIRFEHRRRRRGVRGELAPPPKFGQKYIFRAKIM